MVYQHPLAYLLGLEGVALLRAFGGEYDRGRSPRRASPSSPDMLEQARARVPAADFRQGDPHSLPLPDDHADVIVCALALVHLEDLAPAFREFARVLRPGGHLVITDVHQELVALGSVPRVRSAGGERASCRRTGTGPRTISQPPCRWACRCAGARSPAAGPARRPGPCRSISTPARGTTGPGRCWASCRRHRRQPGGTRPR
jgi:SAM-dependent methyltransferase